MMGELVTISFISVLVLVALVQADPISLVGGGASLSSDYPSTYNPASFAIDGNWTKFAHSNLENTPWFQVYWSGLQTIGGVGIINRPDCCKDRIAPFYLILANVWISSLDIMQIDKYPQNYWWTRVEKVQDIYIIDVPNFKASLLMILQTNQDVNGFVQPDYLNIAEVIPYAPPVVCSPVCQHGYCDSNGVCQCDQGWKGAQCERVATKLGVNSATLSSTYGGHDASQALDGDISTYAHSNQQNQPYIEVNFPLSIIDNVLIINRNDSCEICWNRLNPFWIFLKVTPFLGTTVADLSAEPTVWKLYVESSGTRSFYNVKIPYIAATRVRIVQASDNSYMNIAEIVLSTSHKRTTPVSAVFTASQNGLDASHPSNLAIDSNFGSYAAANAGNSELTLNFNTAPVTDVVFASQGQGTVQVNLLTDGVYWSNPPQSATGPTVDLNAPSQQLKLTSFYQLGSPNYRPSFPNAIKAIFTASSSSVAKFFEVATFTYGCYTNVCQNGGVCSNFETCTCPSGWTGPTCSQYACNCQNGGTCVASNTCTCLLGWKDNSCSTRVAVMIYSNDRTKVVDSNTAGSVYWNGINNGNYQKWYLSGSGATTPIQDVATSKYLYFQDGTPGNIGTGPSASAPWNLALDYNIDSTLKTQGFVAKGSIAWYGNIYANHPPNWHPYLDLDQPAQFNGATPYIFYFKHT